MDEKDKEQVNYDPKSKPWYQKAQVTYCNDFPSLVTPLGIRDPITWGILNTKWQSAPNSLTQDFSTLSVGWLKGQVEGGEEALNENYFIICSSSVAEVGTFKAACDIWRPLLCTEVPPAHEFSELCYDVFPAHPPHMSEAAELRSAEQLSQGGKRSGPAQREGWCSKGPAGRDSPSCSTELELHPATKPREPFLPRIEPSTLLHASAHRKLRCLHSQKAWKSSSKSFKNMVFGLNCKEKPPPFKTHIWLPWQRLSNRICSFAFPLLALPNISRFLYIFGCAPASCDTSILPGQGICVSKWI